MQDYAKLKGNVDFILISQFQKQHQAVLGRNVGKEVLYWGSTEQKKLAKLMRGKMLALPLLS